jgi:hypothetical protein
MSLSEADFQRRVMDTARLAGWMCCHYRPSINRRGRWSTAVEGDKGAPDLILAKAGRVLLAELKSDRGRATLEQRTWLAQLGSHGRLWAPANWEAVLLDLGITKRTPLSPEDVFERTQDAAEG